MARLLRVGSILVVSVLFPPLVGGSAAAQGFPLGPPPSISDAERQAAIAEYQEAQQRFTLLHNEAFRTNQELSAREAGLNELIMRAMVEANPQAEVLMARFEAVRQEAMAAQQAQNDAQVTQLLSELDFIQRDLETARAQVMERDDVQAQVDGLEAAIMETMLDIDPEAQALLARLDELAALLFGEPSAG